MSTTVARQEGVVAAMVVGEGGEGSSRLRRDRRWTTRGREGGACANERH